jgi:hypothetical protein
MQVQEMNRLAISSDFFWERDRLGRTRRRLAYGIRSFVVK